MLAGDPTLTNFPDGHRILRGFSRYMHHTLTEMDGFKAEHLPTQAKTLGKRFMEAVSVFFRDATPSGPIQKLHEYVKGVFENALLLKAQLLAAGSTYAVLAVKPGDPFDPELMTAELEHRAPKTQSSEAVKLCLTPALLKCNSLETLESERTNDMSSCLVHPERAFRPISSGQISGYVTLSKARVVLA